MLSDAVDHVLAGHYWVEPRMTIDVSVQQNGSVSATAWALNEATVEKAARERMLDLVTEVDGRPLSRWGCDGMVFATPTGSTAYAFSAGGPVVWPDVEALLLVPISAHALFAGPMVVSPESVLAAEVIGATGTKGEMSGAVLWCDGRRKVDLPPGARVEVRRGAMPVLLARLRTTRTARPARWPERDIGASFTDRLVVKFGLPVSGWRGRAKRGTGRGGTARRRSETRSRRAMLEEVRISGLGVIDEAVLELSPGFNVVTGETGAGKTMVVSGLGLLFGGRADPTRVRPGAERASVEGRLRIDPDGEVAKQVNNSGGDLDDDGGTLVLVRSVSAEGRSRAFAGGRSVPVSLLTYLSDDLVAVHGQADQQQLLKPGRQRQALDRFAGPEFSRALSDYQRVYQPAPQGRRGAGRADLARPRARRGGRGPAARPDRDRAARTGRRRGPRTARRGRAADQRRHPAHRGDHRARGADLRPVGGELRGGRRAHPARHGPARAREPPLSTIRRSAPWPSRLTEATYLISDVAAELASYADSVEADPARLAVVQDRRAELTRLIRSYGSAPVPQAAVPVEAGSAF